MARTNVKGRSIKYDRHVRLHYWELESAAYRDLDCYARALLVEFKRLYNGANNGDLYLSVRRAAELIGTSKDTATKAIRSLVAHGFIRQETRGSFHLKQRHATTWILTEYDFRGQPADKRFMSWRQPEKQNAVPGVRTDGPTAKDRTPLKPLKILPHGPTLGDRQATNRLPHGPTRRDTSSMPARGAAKRAPKASVARNPIPITSEEEAAQLAELQRQARIVANG